MADMIMKRHDTWPPLQAVLSSQSGPLDLSTASGVKVILKGSTVLITGDCTPILGTQGLVQYSWAVGDLAVSDTYKLEFEITWGPGVVTTVPNDGYNSLIVEDDLENA